MFQGSLGREMPKPTLRSRDAVRVVHRKSLEIFIATAVLCGR